MTPELITSAQNPKLKRLLALQEKSRLRREEGVFVVEGRREFEHCIAAGFEIDSIFICPEICDAAWLGIPPEGRNTRGSIAGGPSRRDGGVSPQGELPKGVHLHPEQLAVLVNHHPSKIGKDSDERRRIAMDRLYALRDSLLAEGISRIVAVGDFNDEVVPAAGLQAAYPEGSGTIKFQGKWEKIDGCPVLEGFDAREHIFAPPHLSTRDSRFAGRKPLRTFSGPRYLGGLSDHYPIILELEFVPKNTPKREQTPELE